MANYLALIRKQDFADLYKYGIFHANRDLIIEFEGDVDNLRKSDNYFHSITAFANNFESTFSYLFVVYKKTDTKLRFCDISIQELQHIYPLDDEAKRELELSFGDHLVIENPLWPNAVLEMEKRKFYNSSLAGTRNLWTIIRYDESLFNYCKNIIGDDVLSDVVNHIFDDKKADGNISLWEYLLRYQRHNMYPHTTLGYFMDAIHVVVNKMAGREMDHYEPTKIFQLLSSIDYSYKSDKIYDILKNSPEAQPILLKIRELCPNVDYLNVATSFLFLKDRYKDGFKFEKDLLQNCSAAWPHEFPLAIYLLGWLLGYNKTYDSLYKETSLPFLKKKNSNKVSQEPEFSDVDNIQISKVSEDMSQVQADYQKSDSTFSVRMGKWNKKKRGFLKRPKPVLVTSQHEYELLLSQGWGIIQEK